MHRDIEEPERQLSDERPVEAPVHKRTERDLLGKEKHEHGHDQGFYPLRGSMLRLSGQELATLYDVGRFRAVALEDLARHQYGGRARDLQGGVRSLTSQGLAQTREVWISPRTKALNVLVLTKLGREAALKHGAHANTERPQAFYAGLVKRKEIRHDAAIYRMFQAERTRLERTGAQIRRVVLDFELKRLVYRPLAKAKALPPADYARLQAQVAGQNGLKVINGKIPLPDLRLEYETRLGETASVDLELATEHYHGQALAEKAQAGFAFYAADGSGAKLSRVLEERDITVAILSL